MPRRNVNASSVAVLAEHRTENAQAQTLSDTADPAAQFRSAAQGHALKALGVLADLMDTASSETVRASAANSVIDRAYGRVAQAVRGGGSTGSEGVEGVEGVELSIAWLNPEKS